MPRLAVNNLVVGQRYTIYHTFSGHQMNKEFRGVNAEGHARFDQFSYDPNTHQFYAIGDPDIPAQGVAVPAQGVVVPVEAPQTGLTPNESGYIPNSIPRKNRTRRNRRKQRRSCRRNSRSCRRNSRSSRRNNMNQHGI